MLGSKKKNNKVDALEPHNNFTPLDLSFIKIPHDQFQEDKWNLNEHS
jgi:hypothetical protein